MSTTQQLKAPTQLPAYPQKPADIERNALILAALKAEQRRFQDDARITAMGGL